MISLEVCVDSIESAKIAAKGGATRIELCMGLALGGLTPSQGLISATINQLDIPIFVLVRPRAGNFTYSEDEVSLMCEDIKIAKELGAQGIVCGCLTQELTVDTKVLQQLLEATGTLPFTFHRAFDWIIAQTEALELLQTLGVRRILSSGGAPTAEAGLSKLNELKALSTTVSILPGGGINPKNIHLFINSNFTEVHLSAAKIIASDTLVLPMNSSRYLVENGVLQTNEDKLAAIRNSL
jgi:copper homeostasis protein